MILNVLIPIFGQSMFQNITSLQNRPATSAVDTLEVINTPDRNLILIGRATRDTGLGTSFCPAAIDLFDHHVAFCGHKAWALRNHRADRCRRNGRSIALGLRSLSVMFYGVEERAFGDGVGAWGISQRIAAASD